MTKNVMIGLGLAGVAAYFIFKSKKANAATGIGVKSGSEQYGPPAPAGVGTQPMFNGDATGNMNGQPSPGTAQTDMYVGPGSGAFVGGFGLDPSSLGQSPDTATMPLGALGAAAADGTLDPEIVGKGAG